VIAFFSAAFAWVWGAGLLVYGAITAAVSGLLALRRRQPALLFWLPLVFLSIHIGAGTGLLWEWLGRSVRRHGKEL
jgi:hypothetical protein